MHPLPTVVLAILLAGTTIGCPSRPPPLSAAEREDQRFSPPAGKASIYIVRPGFVGRDYMLPLVDDRVLGGLLPKNYLRVDVDPGTHTLSSSFAGIDRSPTVAVALAAGDLFFARMLVVYASAVPKTEIQSLGVRSGQQAVREYRAGVPFETGPPSPPTRIDHEKAQTFAPPTGKGLVYLLRRGMLEKPRVGAPSESTALHDAKIAVLLDGHIAALMPKRTYTAFAVDPGHHSVVGVLFPTRVLAPVDFVVEAGQSYFFKATTARQGDGRHAPIQALNPQQARSALRPSQIDWLE